ncbi:MAG: helix-turn-helix domain-containing protein [Pseudonocardiaceae bacterium]
MARSSCVGHRSRKFGSYPSPTVTTGRPSPAKQAREALGVRLREIRSEAGLTARALAVDVGCHYTKISRIEN